MDQFLLSVIVTSLGLGAALLGFQTWKAAHARRDTRFAYLDRCNGLFSDIRTAAGATGFPRLAGHYQGGLFDIQVLPDTLTFRKLPTLWVLVTLTEPLPVRASFDLMIRPTGVEPFSNFHALPHQVNAPKGFPEDCAIRTDAPAQLPDEALLRRHLHHFSDAHIKEMVLSPKGARLVFLAEEAQRGRYLIFRDAEMGMEPLAPDLLTPKLEALLTLRDDLTQYAPLTESLST
ncbi:MAG: hypothetical protein KDA67_05420 [Rhodobacteraceae bacterium]|nr:hypothetical protein [Paracoccaceae bacterium]